jgi:hypothetical protein
MLQRADKPARTQLWITGRLLRRATARQQPERGKSEDHSVISAAYTVTAIFFCHFKKMRNESSETYF